MIALCRFHQGVSVIAALALFLCAPGSGAQEATLRVDAAKPTVRVGPHLGGACIEDVNHEIYGGIYSQMVFGESFQEPPSQSPFKGFRAYDGRWDLVEGELRAGGGDGPKLVSEQPAFAEGEAGVEVFFADRAAGNAGLILKVGKAGIGADNFDGYEVSLNPKQNVLTLGRHCHNWEPIKDTACDVPTGQWITLAVKMTQRSLEVTVNGKRVVTYEDRDHPLPAGGVGLRQWQREARYRNLWVKTGDMTTKLAFERDPDSPGPVSGMWAPLTRGTAKPAFSLKTDQPFIGKQSQKLAFTAGQGEVGIENRGLNRQGFCFRDGKAYEGYVWVRAEKPLDLWLALESGDGAQVLAETKVPVAAGEWRRFDFTLKPEGGDNTGRLALKLKQPGAIVVGHVFLQPGAWGRFKGLPLRKDVVEALIEQKLTVLRYGGSMVNHDDYRWKNMVGPRDRRPPTAGTWYRYSTNGWGIIDFLDLCEATGVVGIPAFNMGETPRDMADFMEYVTGPADSAWGKKRVADGHAQPYGLRYVELGNEERIDDKYVERFTALAEAIWAKDAKVVVVVGDFAYGKPIRDPDRITGAASGISNLQGHRKILELAKKHDREVWFDVHLDTEGPAASDTLRTLPSFVDALEAISGGAKHKVAVFELNSNNHSLRRALGNAVALNAIQRLGDRVPIVCSANGLQVDRQNDNGWNQGLLFMNPCKVWPQPPYFVTQLYAGSSLPQCVKAEVEGAGDALDVTARRDDDGKVLQIQVVNTGAKAIEARVRVNGFKPTKAVAHVTEVSGKLDDVNTAAEPRRVMPRNTEWRHGLAEDGGRYTFPPYSVTILRLE
jgi:alpha-L-arabinofuranosidase